MNNTEANLYRWLAVSDCIDSMILIIEHSQTEILFYDFSDNEMYVQSSDNDHEIDYYFTQIGSQLIFISSC